MQPCVISPTRRDTTQRGLLLKSGKSFSTGTVCRNIPIDSAVPVGTCPVFIIPLPALALASLRSARLRTGLISDAADAAHHEQATLFNSGGTEKNRSAADKRRLMQIHFLGGWLRVICDCGSSI